MYTTVGCPVKLETLDQIRLVQHWMVRLHAPTVDPREQPFLMRQLQRLAPQTNAQFQAPRGAA